MSKVPVIDVNSSDVHECDNQCNLRTPMSVLVPVSPCINNDNETMLRSTNIQMEYAVKDTSKGILGTTNLSNSCENRLTQGTNTLVPNLCATPQCYQNSRRSPFTGVTTHKQYGTFASHINSRRCLLPATSSNQEPM